MTMLDEQLLEQLLAEAADEIEVPRDGAARIEAAAEGLDRRSVRASRGTTDAVDGNGRTARSTRSYRVMAVAASVVVVVLVAVAALGHVGSSGSTVPPHSHTLKSASNQHAAAPGVFQGALPAGAPSLSPPANQLYGQGASGSTLGAVSPALPPTGPSGADVAGPKIESTGSMNLTVRHLDTAVSALTAVVAGDGGYVAAEQTQSASPGVPASGTVTLQVPQTSFSRLVDQVKRLGVSSAVSTKQVNVTGQYVDLQAQITALKATQQQYLTIMTRAQTIGDVLAVQDRLDSVNSQLQQVEGELHLLDSQTSYGTLTVDLSEPSPKPKPAPAAAATPKPPTGLAAAWSSARHGFANGVYWVVRQTGGLAFLILLAGLLYLLGRVGRRGLRRLAL